VSLRDAAVYALLAAGVGLLGLSVLGVAFMRGVYDRLHYTGLAAPGGAALCAAVVVRDSFSLIGNKAVVLGLFLLAASPVLVHATARAARIREHGRFSARDDPVEVEEL
jgi:multisubunit Na+/H+ antiporter MnhG subunit